MQTYSEFSPTPFDQKGLGLEDKQDWLVLPVFRNRDSKALEESNFVAAIKLLGGESDDVEVHSFNHWGPGWFEIILINPAAKNILSAAEKIESRLESYPILDEDDYYQREWYDANETWQHCFSLRERIQLCHEAGISIFAARSREIPRNDPGYIFERCCR